jgi:hypothetical protein
MLRLNLIGIVYLVVGLVVAANHHYLASLDTVKRAGSAVLATTLWPLLFLGINLHIR